MTSFKYSTPMHKAVTLLVGFILLLTPTAVFAQVFNQSQVIISPYGSNGFLVSTTSSTGGKLQATTTPYFANFFAGNGTIGNLTVGSCSGCGTTGSSFSTSSLSALAPLHYSQSPLAQFSITQSGTAADGYLSSTDFNTFNNKISSTSLSVTTSGTSGAATYTPSTGVFNIPQYQAAGTYITALTGDVTASGPGSSVATLATVNVSPGTYTYATLAVNAKGLVTSASNGAAPENPLTFLYPLSRSTNTISFIGLSTTSPWTGSGVAYRVSDNQISTAATSTLSGTGPISVSNSPAILGLSGAVISCSSCLTSAVTSVTASYPILSSGGNTPNISTAFGTTSTWGLGNNGLVMTGSTGIPFVTATSSAIALSITGSAGSVANAVTFNNGGAGGGSGSTFNGSGALTVSYNTIGAQVAGTYVTSVSGTANQITSSGGTTPTLSLPNYVLFPSSYSAALGSTTNATSTNLSVTASSTLATLFGAALSGCNGASNALTWSAGLFGCNTITGDISSVSNSDGTLTISPTTGAVVASLALAHVNSWSGAQTFAVSSSTLGSLGSGSSRIFGGSGILQIGSTNGGSNLTWYVQDGPPASILTLSVGSITGSRTQSFPSASGTFALGTGSTGNCAQWSATNILTTTGSPCAAASFPFTPTTSFGTAANSTSTLLLLTQGLSASSTITFGNANGTQLSFNSSTGNLGLGTSTPYAQFGIFASSTTGVGSPTTIFSISSTTSTFATTTLFSISNTGSTTAANGFNITAGCYAFNGACLTAGSIGGGTTEAVNWATAAVLAGTPTYSNGVAGVGATLTEVGNGALSVDGNSPAAGDRVLVKNQASAFQNGIYVVTATGSGLAVYVLTRSSDYNTPTEITPGIATYVLSGTANTDTTWAVSYTVPLTIGTTNLSYSETAGGGGSVTSVAASVPGFLSISGSPITTSGTLAISYSGTALPVANGGTNQTSFSVTNGLVAFDGTRLNNFAGYTLTSSLLSTLNASSSLLSANYAAFGATATSTFTSTGMLGVGTTSPWGFISINANALGTSPAFAIGSTTSTWFAISNGGGIQLTETLPATTTTITLDWAAGPTAGPTIDYQIGFSATTITVINATTTQYAGSRKLVMVCNPNGAAGALTWKGVEWAGGTAPTQTTTANACDEYSIWVTHATSTSAYKVFGGGSTGFN